MWQDSQKKCWILWLKGITYAGNLKEVKMGKNWKQWRRLKIRYLILLKDTSTSKFWVLSTDKFGLAENLGPHQIIVAAIVFSWTINNWVSNVSRDRSSEGQKQANKTQLEIMQNIKKNRILSPYLGSKNYFDFQCKKSLFLIFSTSHRASLKTVGNIESPSLCKVIQNE